MTPDQMRDASLLELFSLEADAQTQVLSAGLLALERNPTQADQLEACMRAAHSLKGAARIVGVDAGVSVAHVMEDCLVSAQESRLYLQPEHIDALLQGTDLLMRIATPGNDVGPADIEGYVALMERLLDPSQPMAKVAPPSPPAPVPAPAPVVEEPPPEPEPAPPVTSELPRQNKRMTEGGERVLRVTAERLNSLLDLSSKSLVETQRLKPYLASMQRLKRIQSQSARALDTLDGQLKTLDLNLEAQEALADTRRLLSEAQALLAEKTAELDEFGWQAGQRAQVLYDTALACRMRPFADVLAGQVRMVRDLGRSLGKQVRLEIEGEKTQVDRDVLEKLEAPLTHLLRNAVDHGIEMPEQRLLAGKPAEGLIRLRASHQAGLLVLELSDDGNGVDLERLRGTIVGLMPLFAVLVLEQREHEGLEGLRERLLGFMHHRPDLAKLVSRWNEPGQGNRLLLALLRGERTKDLLRRMLDDTEFLSAFGVRSLSKAFAEQPLGLKMNGDTLCARYQPGESDSRLYGGNSNWRGPLWMPVNYMLIESLREFHRYYADNFSVEYPAGSGYLASLEEVADSLSQRLTRLFLRDENGSRPSMVGYAP